MYKIVEILLEAICFIYLITIGIFLVEGFIFLICTCLELDFNFIHGLIIYAIVIIVIILRKRKNDEI